MARDAKSRAKDNSWNDGLQYSFGRGLSVETHGSRVEEEL
jgi:hypothetical protein